LIRTFVPATDGNLYGFGNTGKVYKINPDFSVFQVYDLKAQITGATEKPSSSGQTYLMFADRTNLHIKKLPGRADWNDVNKDSLQGFPKTNLSAQDFHTMEEVGGAVHIANGSSLALVGYDDSYTNNALDLIPGNTAKTIVERNGRSVTGTYRTADPTKGANGAVDTEVPLAQVGDEGAIFFQDFSSTIASKVLPGGGKVNPGGMKNRVTKINFFDWEENALSYIDKQSVGNMAIMGVWGATSGYGGLYSYGRLTKDDPFVLNLDFNLDVDEIGAVCSLGGIDYVSYRSGSTFGVKVTDLTTKATGTYDSLDLKAPVKTPIDITAWDYVELFMDSLPSGASVQVWYRMNKAGLFVRANTGDGQTSYSVANGKKATFNIGSEGEVFEIRVVVVPTGNSSPNVYRIRTYFS